MRADARSLLLPVLYNNLLYLPVSLCRIVFAFKQTEKKEESSYLFHFY